MIRAMIATIDSYCNNNSASNSNNNKYYLIFWNFWEFILNEVL